MRLLDKGWTFIFVFSGSFSFPYKSHPSMEFIPHKIVTFSHEIGLDLSLFINVRLESIEYWVSTVIYFSTG